MISKLGTKPEGTGSPYSTGQLRVQIGGTVGGGWCGRLSYKEMNGKRTNPNQGSPMVGDDTLDGLVVSRSPRWIIT